MVWILLNTSKAINDIMTNFKMYYSQVLIQVKSAGVNPVDTYIRSGKHAIKPTLPYVPGNDGAGIVEQVGNEVTKFKVSEIWFSN